MQQHHSTQNSPLALAMGGSLAIRPSHVCLGLVSTQCHYCCLTPLLPRKFVPLHGLQKIYFISVFVSSLLLSINSPFSSQNDEQTILDHLFKTFQISTLSFSGGSGDASLILGSRRSAGGGNGNPLQYSCLENMDRGAWQATVHGVTKSWTRLSMHTDFRRNTIAEPTNFVSNLIA